MIGEGLAAVASWVAGHGPDADLDRPDVSDPRVLAAARLLTRLMAAAFISESVMYGWLVVEAWRLWVEHGPCAELAVPVGNVAYLGQAALQVPLLRVVRDEAQGLTVGRGGFGASA